MRRVGIKEGTRIDVLIDGTDASEVEVLSREASYTYRVNICNADGEVLERNTLMTSKELTDAHKASQVAGEVVNYYWEGEE